MANTKKDFLALKQAQAKSDIREKYVGGTGEVDPEVRDRKGAKSSTLVDWRDG